jgi:biotin carboxylase
VTIALVESVHFGLGEFVQAARARSHELVLLTGDRSRYMYELEKIDVDVAVIDVDTADVNAMARVLHNVPDLAGVVRSADRWSLPTLELAQRLGLPHQNNDAVRLLADKARLRDHLFQRGFSRSRSTRFGPWTADLATLAAALPYPCVVKHDAGSSSENVWLAQTAADLPDIIAEARMVERLLNGKLTAEKYFSGPMYSLETVTWDGQTRVLGVTSRGLSSLPHFREETAAFPVLMAPPVLDELTGWIGSILTSVGYDLGVTHTEFVITESGFEIIEINSRMGGALIGLSVNRALGVSLHGALLDLALGQRPALLDEPAQVMIGVAQVALYAPAPGRFAGITGADLLHGHPGRPEVYPLRAAGDHINSVIDQRGLVALVLAEGDTSELALNNATSAAGKLIVRMAYR